MNSFVWVVDCYPFQKHLGTVQELIHLLNIPGQGQSFEAWDKSTSRLILPFRFSEHATLEQRL